VLYTGNMGELGGGFEGSSDTKRPNDAPPVEVPQKGGLAPEGMRSMQGDPTVEPVSVAEQPEAKATEQDPELKSLTTEEGSEPVVSTKGAGVHQGELPKASEYMMPRGIRAMQGLPPEKDKP